MMRDALIEKLQHFGDRTAMIDRGTEHSYADLVREIRAAEAALEAAGVREHHAVVLNGEFSLAHTAALLALYLRRAVIVPVVEFTDNIRDTIESACRPTHILSTRGGTVVEPTGTVAADDSSAPYRELADAGASGLVLLSSGSTGAPKAILHNFDALVEEKVGTGTRVGRHAPHILLFLLADHIGGINSLLGVLRGGATAVVPALRTPEEICGLIERYGIRLLPTSPTFLNLIMLGGFHRKFDLTSLRLITYGTEPMPPELLRRVNEELPRVRLLQTFGTSETGIATTESESSQSTYFRIDDAGVEFRIVDGELQLRTKTQFMGYLNYSDEAVTDDGWFRTGDLVEEGEDGFIRIRGRAKEIINVGGEKVLPLELESILMASPLITDCVVYGKPNSITGQAVCVDLVPEREMGRAEARRHVEEFLDGKVEPFKIPSKVKVIEQVAMSARFKKRRIEQ